MNCWCDETLHYCSPAHGNRGNVRVGMLVPESIQLFAVPFACGRHGAISAIQKGYKDRLFYLYIDQSDIIRGYDDAIVQAVEQVLSFVERRPRVMLIFVSCLDDLIGTDHEALMDRLSEKYPDIIFRDCHMNPISKGGKMPPPVNIQRRVFGLLSPAAEKDMGVNLVGNLVDIPPECELHQVLRDKGLGPLRHITQYDTFDGFQQMARSQANLVLVPAARYAAEQMNRSLKIPYLYLPVSYRLETIDEQYRQIHQMLLSQRNGDAFDLEIPRMRASQAIEKARSAVGDTPVIVDASATAHPFDLARALMEYGFSVRRIAAQECPACDQDNMRWVMEHHPDVMSLVGSPVPMVIGSDLEGIAAELEARTHIPCFGFNTTGTAYYDKGAAKATIALLHRFTSCTETVPRRINIVGATPMDFGTGENIDDLVSLVSDAGYHVWCRLTMGYTLEQLKQAASAEVNLAVSRTGYLIAEFMWQRYRIPYLCGLPMGQNGSMSYLDSLEKVIQRKTPVILRGEPCEDPDVLIVGEQVQANSIRIALASEYGISNVAVGCIFGCQDQLKLSQDLDLRCEREILTALNESRYNMIVADPLLKNLLPRGNRACFKAHPQYAVSSKAGGESVRFISKYFNHWYEKG